MHINYFPPCPVDGPIEPPVSFAHMGWRGAVPKKCAECEYLFEGECTRFIDEVGRYLNLDHGPCGVTGPTDPVTCEERFINLKVEVPRKCATCAHLVLEQFHGLHCSKDSTKWGDYHRGLDWGTWQPDQVYLQLLPPKVTTKTLSQHAYNNDLIAFIKEHRRINPGLSIEEAKADFKHFRAVIEKLFSVFANRH